jgi:hypothetical protein
MKLHRDVEFHVDMPNAGHTRAQVFGDFASAAAHAVNLAIGTGKARVDVCIWSEAGAKAFAGADGIERYREDPDASVFERIEISVNVVGRVA